MKSKTRVVYNHNYIFLVFDFNKPLRPGLRPGYMKHFFFDLTNTQVLHKNLCMQKHFSSQ